MFSPRHFSFSLSFLLLFPILFFPHVPFILFFFSCFPSFFFFLNLHHFLNLVCHFLRAPLPYVLPYFLLPCFEALRKVLETYKTECFFLLLFFVVVALFTKNSSSIPGRGFSHHTYYICASLLGSFFAKFDIGLAIGGGSSETKEPKLHRLGVFWANYCKKHPLLIKIGCFSFENGILIMGGILGRKIGIEKVRFSRSGRHIHARFW